MILKKSQLRRVTLILLILAFLSVSFVFSVGVIPGVITEKNASLEFSAFSNVTTLFTGQNIFFFANYSDDNGATEGNSTFKWYKRTLPQPQNRSLVGYWKLDGNGNDSSAYNNHGTMTNGVRSNQSMDCKVDDCLTFDGINDFVNASTVMLLVMSRDALLEALTKSLMPSKVKQSSIRQFMLWLLLTPLVIVP